MRMGYLGSLATLFVGAGLAVAQNAQPMTPESQTLPTAQAIELAQAANPADMGAAPAKPVPAAVPLIQGCANGQCAPCVTDACAPCCDVCGPAGRFWGSAEYLLWWTKDGPIPPLLTAGPPGSFGAVGSPGTVVLFGNSYDNNLQSGGRFSGGYWLNECQTFGIGGSYFFLASRNNNIFVGANGGPNSPTIGVPFFDITPPAFGGVPGGAENADVAALAGISSGTIGINTSTRLQGADLNAISNLSCCCDRRVDLIAGFRYLQLNEDIGITETTNIFPGVPFIGGRSLIIADGFSTTNRFYGGQIGLSGEVRRGDFFVDGLFQLGLGLTHSTVDITGSTRITPAGGAAVVLPGGNLALPTNIGSRTHDSFSWVPQVGVNVGYQVTDNVRAFVGYTFLYWSDVLRPGDQIDRVVNTTQSPVNLAGAGALVGPARPAPIFRESDFWAQGFNLGLQVRF